MSTTSSALGDWVVGTFARLVIAVLYAATPSAAATPYLKIEPGRSTQSDVTTVVGPPVTKLADIHEHKPPQGARAIFVEYQFGSDIVERIEVKLRMPLERVAAIKEWNLPQQSAFNQNGSDGNLVEYYGNNASILLLFSGREPTSFVHTVAFLSDRLFEAEVARAKRTVKEGPPRPPIGGTTESPAPPLPPAQKPSPPVVSLPDDKQPPTVSRDPAAYYDVFLWAGAESEIARKSGNVSRRQKAMAIRIFAQAGDCDRAKSEADAYKRQFLNPL